jgi:4-hydroxybenzoate polyprenyltransferase
MGFSSMALIKASHLEPSVAVTLIALALATSTGRSAWGVAGVGSAVLAGQLSIGWCNDYLDRQRDTLAQRRDKPVAEGRISSRIVWRAAWTALVGCIPLSLASGWLAALVHLFAVALAWAYNFGLKATVLSFVPYTLAFGLLPAFVVLGLPGPPAVPWWLWTTGALLGSGAHFANALPDLETDEASGVRGLPHRIGPTASRWASTGLLLVASLVVTLGPSPSPSLFSLVGLGLVGVLIFVGMFRPQVFGRRGAFRASIGVACLDVLLFVVAAHSVR